jgi:DNA-binding transcriptional MerR regulator
MLNIGQPAAASGVSTKTMRHCVEVGLLPATQCTGSGYRQYVDSTSRSSADVAFHPEIA